MADKFTPFAPEKAMRELSRVDGRRLVTSPWFLVGFCLALLGSITFARVVITDSRSTWDDDGWTIGAGFILWAIFTMVAVNRAALRDHREHTGEQHDALPVGAGTRAVGMVGATLWPATFSTVLLALVAGFAATKTDIPSITVVQVVHNGALVMMLGALGVAFAAWIPSSFVGPVAAFGFYLVHPGEVAASWHAIWPFATLRTATLGIWHTVYLIALAAVLTVVAATRRNPRRANLVALIAAATVAAVAVTVVVNGVCPSPAGPCLL
jgi:hypothetical protein